MTTEEVTAKEEVNTQFVCAAKGKKKCYSVRRVGAVHLGVSCAQEMLPA